MTHAAFDRHDAREQAWDLVEGAAPDAFRAVMRRVVGGVAIVATTRNGRPWGMTVSAYAPVCMEPPTLLVCVNAATATASDIDRDRQFSLNLLSESQCGVSQRCSRAGDSKYLDDAVVAAAELPARFAMPVLQDSVASFDCDVEEIRRVGTHFVVIGAIRVILAPRAHPPLLYGQGRYLGIAALGAVAQGADA